MFKNLFLLFFITLSAKCFSISSQSEDFPFEDGPESLPISPTSDSENSTDKRAILKKKYRKLEEQHMVVMVLAKQYNKELSVLRSIESRFCNYYNLDIEKWRKNSYVWDDVTGVFLERNTKNKNPEVDNNMKMNNAMGENKNDR